MGVDARIRTLVAVVIVSMVLTAGAGCAGAPAIAPSQSASPSAHATATLAVATATVAPATASATPSTSPRSTPAKASAAPTPANAPTPYPHTVKQRFGHVYITPHVIHGEFLWAVNRDDKTLYKISVADSVTKGRIMEEFPTGGSPHALLAHDGFIWQTAIDAPNEGYVRKVDPATGRELDRITIGIEGYRMVIHEGVLWITSFLQSAVVRVDLETREISDHFRLPDATDIVAADDGVWVARHFTGILTRFDPRTLETTTIDTGMELSEFMALTDDAVWLNGGDAGELVAVSRTTNEVVARIPGEHFEGITAHEGTLWAGQVNDNAETGEHGRVVEIDATTMTVRNEYPLPLLGPSAIAVDNAADTRELWITGLAHDGVILMTLKVAAN